MLAHAQGVWEAQPGGEAFDRNQTLLLAALRFSRGSWSVLARCSLGLGLLGVWVEGGPAARCGPTERRGREAPVFTHLPREAPWWRNGQWAAGSAARVLCWANWTSSAKAQRVWVGYIPTGSCPPPPKFSDPSV